MALEWNMETISEFFDADELGPLMKEYCLSRPVARLYETDQPCPRTFYQTNTWMRFDHDYDAEAEFNYSMSDKLCEIRNEEKAGVRSAGSVQAFKEFWNFLKYYDSYNKVMVQYSNTEPPMLGEPFSRGVPQFLDSETWGPRFQSPE